MKLTIDKVKKCVLNKWDWVNPIKNISVFLWGPIGIGKTEVVQQIVAERMLFECDEQLKTASDEKDIQALQIRKSRLSTFKEPKEIIDLLEEHLLMIRLAERNIELLTGFPCPVPANRNMIFLMPENMTKIKEDSWCVVFLDELDKADSAKLCATTNITEARRIGDFFFPKDTFVIVAANRIQDSVLSQPIPSELRNRAFHIEVETTPEIWCNWAHKKGIRKDVVNFVYYKHKNNQNFLMTTQDTTLPDAENAFLTPRTLVMGANHLDKLETLGYSLDEMISEFAGFVGDRAAIEYGTYVKLYSKVDIMNILKGIEKVPRQNGPQTNSGQGAVLNTQYIYGFAIIEKLTSTMLDEPTHITNLANAINDMHPNIRIILLSSISENSDILEKFSNHPSGAAVIKEYLNKMRSAI